MDTESRRMFSDDRRDNWLQLADRRVGLGPLASGLAYLSGLLREGRR
jgi:hypothetical protein